MQDQYLFWLLESVDHESRSSSDPKIDIDGEGR
jgi:hypothetical protein